MRHSLAVAAAAALVAALPLSAGAVTIAGNLVDTDLTAGSGADNTYDVLIGSYSLSAQFTSADSPGEMEFGFVNNSANAVNMQSVTTVAQLAGTFSGGATSSLTGTPDRTTDEGLSEAFLRNFTIGAGETVFLKFAWGDPGSIGTTGAGPALAIQVNQVPLPASVLMLLGALSGLGYVGFASRRRGATAA